jgi:hypothetical protein
VGAAAMNHGHEWTEGGPRCEVTGSVIGAGSIQLIVYGCKSRN